MGKKLHIFGLSPAKLKQLLQLGEEVMEPPGQTDKVAAKAELLAERLAETVPVDPRTLHIAPQELAGLLIQMGCLAGESISAYLLSPDTPLKTIVALKDYSKRLTETAKTEAENDTAVVLYYAAIGYALVNHGEKITHFSHEAIIHALTKLLGKTWVPREIEDIFRRAIDACRS